MKRDDNTKQRINVIGQYTDGPDELVLKANAEGLHVLAERIRLSEDGDDVCLFVPDPALVSPAPYTGFLTNIVISHTDTAVNIQRSNTALSIAGSKEFLNTLARNIEFLVTSPHGSATHAHIEYYSGAIHLHPLCEPLIVYLLMK